MGLLHFNGHIDLSQFWPTGESDADTVHVNVQGPFLFKDNAGNTKETHALDDATVGGEKVIKGNRIKIRLQGIDTPELHYNPQSSGLGPLTDVQKRLFKKYNKRYRQFLAETTTVGLHDLLRRAGQGSVSCTVTTIVDVPNEVFDVYGRFIGNIIVKIDSRDVDINLRLVEDGLAFPAFYSSMTSQEILDFIEVTQAARKIQKGLWKYYEPAVGKLNLDLVYRDESRHPQFNPGDDIGNVIFPKIFRRLCNYTALSKARVFTGAFKQYLGLLKDTCFLTEEFLEQGVTASTGYSLNDFIDTYQEFDVWPEELVFQEKSSVLMKDGKIVKDW